MKEDYKNHIIFTDILFYNLYFINNIPYHSQNIFFTIKNNYIIIKISNGKNIKKYL